jgi:hypothetical protein
MDELAAKHIPFLARKTEERLAIKASLEAREHAQALAAEPAAKPTRWRCRWAILPRSRMMLC